MFQNRGLSRTSSSEKLTAPQGAKIWPNSAATARIALLEDVFLHNGRKIDAMDVFLDSQARSLTLTLDIELELALTYHSVLTCLTALNQQRSPKG